MKSMITEWHKVAKVDRQIRREAVNCWLEFPIYVMMEPFQAWKSSILGRKTKDRDNQRIVETFVRWKGRQKLRLIVKTWRHQVIFMTFCIHYLILSLGIVW